MWCRVVRNGGATTVVHSGGAPPSDQFPASKIICKCQSILTVCGDVFQITIYNSNDKQQASGKKLSRKKINKYTYIKWSSGFCAFQHFFFFFWDFSLAFFFGGQGFFSSTKHRNAAGKACLSSVLIKPQFFCTPKSRWKSTSRWVIYIKYFINNQRVKIQPYYGRALQRNQIS